MSHTPVLVNEVLEVLDPKPGEHCIDCTLGGGGHARAILDRTAPDGRMLAIDLDEDAIARVRRAMRGSEHEKRIVFEKGNFADVKDIATRTGFPKADCCIADLGFSSYQLQEGGRGFSFSPESEEEPLMMSYDKDAEVGAAHLLHMLSYDELRDFIRELSGERCATRIAKNIVTERKKKRIITVGDLNAIIKDSVPKGYERGRIHPSTRTFMALRIAVNNELDNVRKLLAAAPDVMSEGGRIAIISFHSLEDRIVKTVFREMGKAGKAKIITKKPIVPTREEVIGNPRSRSAKLRACTISHSQAPKP